MQVIVDEPISWGAKVSHAFKAKVVEICSRQKIVPDYLMACMAFETGEVVVYGSQSAVTLWAGTRPRNLARLSAVGVSSVALPVGAELVLNGQGDGSVRLWKPSKPD